MNVKFIKIWICLVIIFLSFVNGNHQPGRTIVKIEEDPLVDKITKVNHNLKLVKLKKVKKVYSNLDDEDQSNVDISKKQTIVDLNTKNNIATQTPISFLILDKPIKNDQINDDLKNNNHNLIGNRLLDELIRDHHKLPNDLITNKLPDNLKEKTDSSNDNLKISPNNLSFNKQLNQELNEKNDKIKNDIKNNEIEIKNNEKNQQTKSIKKLFPSINKFKQLNLNKSNLQKTTSVNPFTSSSNKSTFKTEFINKITTKKSYFTTTIKPIANQIKKIVNIKTDRFKSFTTTTIEPPRTYATYRSNKKTTTFKPYIYSTTTSSTIEPIFRIRKSKPTTIKIETTTQTSRPTTDQTVRTTISQINKLIPITTSKPFLNNKFNYKNEIKNDKQTTKSPNTDKSDLETHNSSRKYAKLFLNNRRSNDQITTSSFMKYTTKLYTTTTPLPIEISTNSYLRTNSRVTTFSSYIPYSIDYTKTTIIPDYKKDIELNTENSIKNEINKEKILTASRKRPIIRPRRVKPTQLEQLKTTPLSKLEITTENPILTTTYSPKFRSTTIYPIRFRSTTQTSSTKYLNQFTTTTSAPIVTTIDDLKSKEFKLYRNLDKDIQIKNELPINLLTNLPNKIINELPIGSTTELPATSRFYKDDLYSKNDLVNNLIPRKSKWILKDDKGTRQKKSDYSYAYNMNDYTQPMRTNTISPIETTTIRYVTTINSIELRNKLNKEFDKSLNETPEDKIIDRAPKSVDTFYQMRRPQAFLIGNQNKDEQSSSILKDLKYEEPKRNIDVNTIDVNTIDVNTIDPDKEIYYKDTKVRKESKLVPQTYFYPTSAPSLNEINEKLSYLNEAKLKYQRPYLNDKKLENKKYEKPIDLENKLDADDPKFRYPNLPSNIPYHIPNKYQNINDNNQNDRKPYLEDDNKLPYIKTHFNLGHQLNDSPQYGNLLKQVGKLSKPFSNQSPLPFLQPIKSGLNDQNEPELRYPIKNNQDEENDRNVHRVVDLRPFDYKNYQPLPNAKFIRTDLDNERLAKNIPIKYEKPIENIPYLKPIVDEKYKSTNYNKPTEIALYKPIDTNPYNNNYQFNKIDDNISYNKLIDHNNYDKKDDTHYKPKDYTNYHKPLDNNYNKLINLNNHVIDYSPYKKAEIENHEYNKPINHFNKPIENTQPLRNIQPTTFNPHLNYDYNNLDRPSSTGYLTDKNTRFNLNRIPAKVVYDRYNQKFSGAINLKPAKYTPTSKHYVEIPKNISPIEYQRKPLLPISNPIKPYEKNYRPPAYKPIYNDYNNNYRNNKLPSYNELDDKDKEYRPIYNENPVYNYPNKLTNYPINNYQKPNKIINPYNRDKEYKQIYNHPNNYIPNNQNNLKFNYPNNYKQFERDYQPLSSPVYYNQNKPIYYNQFINHQKTLNNNPNNQYKSQFRDENNNLINQNQMNNQYNAGHYDNNIYLKPTKDVELINLSDITPNLSLFKNGIPNFQLLQNTVISHDIPIAKNYNL